MGSIPCGVTRISHSINLSGRTKAPASNRPLTEVSTVLSSGVKGCRCVGLTNLPQPPGALRGLSTPEMGLLFL
jgi:hypothetical protein